MKESNISMKIILLILFFSFLPIKAQIPLSEYNRFKDIDVYKEYIWGVSQGYSWANANLAGVDEREPLYCQPPKMLLNRKNIHDMLEREIKDYGHLYPKDGPLEQILLNALKRTFPCNN